MAKFAISVEGAHSMKDLASGLLQCTNAINDLNAGLVKRIVAIENGLGIYGEDINNIVIQSNLKINEVQDSINFLAQRINQKSDEILALLGLGEGEYSSFDGAVYSETYRSSNGNNVDLQPNRSTPRDLPMSQYVFSKDADGNNVYDSPMEMNDYLYRKQGSAKWNFQGTCGLCSCANILRLAGVNADEEQMINFASTTMAPNSLEKLCATGHFNPGRNGGTNPEGRRCILEHFGISSGLFDVDMDNTGGATQGTMNTISDLVSSGKGVILSVHADMLWHDAPYGINDYHAVTVTSVKKDNAGNVLGFYICDSAKGGTIYYSNDKLRRALTGARMNVTHQIIR